MQSIRRTFRPIDHKLRYSAAWMLLPPVVAAGVMFPLAGTRALPVVALFASFWLVMAIVVYFDERWARTFRVRLLPDGIRITRWNRTFDFSEPAIVQPQNPLSLRTIVLQSGKQKLQLPLLRFKRREQAILLEHCSQFLTPQQQRTCGQQWARRYAALITDGKPKPVDLLSIWNVITACMVVSILVVPLILESQRTGFTTQEWWEDHEVRRLLLTALTGVVMFGPFLFACLWTLDWFSRRFPRKQS
jgi:hypothetical protein